MSATTAQPAVARRLSQLETDVLTACLHHRLLTTEQLRALLAPHRKTRWMQTVTRRLADIGMLAHVSDRNTSRARPRLVWYATDTGRAAVQHLVHERRHVMTAEKAANALQRHTLLGNDVGIAFARHARRLGHHCGPFDWDHEVGHRYGHAPRAKTVVPDLVVRCWLRHDTGDTLLTRFCEIDRGQYSPLVLRNKIRTYAELLTYTGPALAPGAAPPRPAWTRVYPVFPKLLIVFADQSPAAAGHRIDVLTELCHADRHIRAHLDTLWLGCARLDEVLDAGPYAPIWRTPLADEPADLLAEARPGPVVELGAGLRSGGR
ncbi:replication-relaxation family protein [Actinoplanes sp. G11-F43]|uniref:replication-relaxation family protein n=1 Tax=Actinoplanes sp. G11-F43 TaxID=3424130 RepID=UPI003D345BA2